MAQQHPSGILKWVYIGSGFASALVLLINAAKRAELIPVVPITQLVAPLAQVFAIGLVIGIVVAARALHGLIGSIGATLYVAALAGLVGVEFVINLVFPYVERATIDALLEGPLAVAFIVASVTFLTGTLLFFGAFWREPGSPKIAIAIAVVSSVPIALRNMFPEVALQIGIVGLAVAVAWFAVWLLRRTAHSAAE